MISLFESSRERAERSLPLFPLRTVLFPGGVLPIKIFEQRYIDMAKRCFQDGSAFGVCLLTGGEEVAASGVQQQFAAIGTVARIVHWDMPQLGILHIGAEGDGRFRVASHRVERDGLVVGSVVPLAPEPTVTLAPDYAPLAALLELIAGRVGPQNFPQRTAYDDASWVGYRLAELLPLPLHIKQTMLEVSEAQVRLKVLRQFLLDQGLL
ncbi:MAG: LON peptidase substrate-binding domain-containing protein [Proteobacteria bacterium]|nr:LON peptidase substrate-binding domain-containing protein [Pseudomonadota bacterium]